MTFRDIIGNTIRVSFYIDDLNLLVPVEVQDLTVVVKKVDATIATLVLADNPDDLWKDAVETKYWLRIVTTDYTAGTYTIYYNFVYGSDAYRYKDTLILTT